MSWRDDIKNRINQIEEKEIIIVNEFPNKDDFGKNSYRECWITCLFVDIANYTKICETKKNEDVGIIIRTFHEGILDIMNHYKLKHIQIQGDGIFGVLPTKNENCSQSKDIFYCAMEINGYLTYFWKKADFRISIAEKEELMIVVGKDNDTIKTREVVFAGGAINNAKHQMEDERTNCILINKVFETRNKSILWNEKKNESYICGTTNKGIKYSTWYYGNWK